MDSRPQVPQKTHQSTASTQERRMQSFNTTLEDRKIGNGSTLKFGTQMNMDKLRSDDERVSSRSPSHVDPLNWPRWKKEIAFASIMLTAATIGSLKTIFVTVNSLVAIELGVSYSSAAALTGVPLIFGAVSGIVSRVLAQMIGKRGVLLGSSVLMLVAALWNMHVRGNYVEFMFSRIFQGVGWGAFEGLIQGCITDLFFDRERAARANAYNVVNLVFTWGTPILGGYLSQSTESFRNQIMVINIIQAFGIVFLIFGTPETTFDRSSEHISSGNIPSTTPLKRYLSTLKLKTGHSTRPFSITTATQPLKALYAPSTLFNVLLSVPLSATAFGLAQSLSLIFTSMPTFLFPSRLGYLFILPLAFSLITYALSSTTIYLRTKPPRHLSSSSSNITLALAIPSLVLAVVGLLSLGVYTEMAFMPALISSSSGDVFSLLTGPDISLKLVSALFGLLVAGSVSLSFTSSTYLSASQSSSAKAALLTGGVGFWEELMKGVWCMGMPVWIQGSEMSMVMGMKDTGIALGVLSVVFGSTVCAVFWCKGEQVRGVDGRVLGVVVVGGEEGEGELKRKGSYMDV